MAKNQKAVLQAKKREGTGKGVARKLRQDGRVPAVLYGRELESLHLSVNAHDADHLFRSISVDNTIVTLEVEGEKVPFETLVREIQTHPWKPSMLHVDFLRIQAGVEVDLDVPVELEGIPVGVRLNGGVLEQIIHELPVRCIPSKIPESFILDVTDLDLNDSLHVSDIVLEEGIELRLEGDQTVCAVTVPRVVEEAEVEGEELEPGLVGERVEGEEEQAGESGGDDD
ncbi:MAG: 50S ribosomal protein L25 [Gemmatimonadota bacterium]|nr:50S ribosomal protein L25 [Gemmatimonadota bacterium]MDH3422549.1 50S ribosomal protein L25 [Gemmatimonadota bacterium]